jgi:type II secretory pathway pseudopilin PulG
MKKGQSLIELLIILALLAIILPALFYGMITSREGKPQQQQRITGLSYLHEAEEAAINVRNRSWDAFAVNGTFHPSNSGNYWTLVAGSETVNGFTRQIVISDVYRDSNGAITTSGGTLDLSTKKVVTTVSWTLPRSTSIDSTIYITRHENIPYIETTKAQFDLGTRTNTYSTNTAGGEVILGAGGGGGDWCIPSYAVTTVDL